MYWKIPFVWHSGKSKTGGTRSISVVAGGWRERKGYEGNLCVCGGGRVPETAHVLVAVVMTWLYMVVQLHGTVQRESFPVVNDTPTNQTDKNNNKPTWHTRCRALFEVLHTYWLTQSSHQPQEVGINHPKLWKFCPQSSLAFFNFLPTLVWPLTCSSFCSPPLPWLSSSHSRSREEFPLTCSPERHTAWQGMQTQMPAGAGQVM